LKTKLTLSYNFDLSIDRVNKMTCHDGKLPATGESCQQDDSYLECGPGESYVIELFDKLAQTKQGVSSPPSLGSFSVTK